MTAVTQLYLSHQVPASVAALESLFLQHYWLWTEKGGGRGVGGGSESLRPMPSYRSEVLGQVSLGYCGSKLGGFFNYF